jgi:hypothetical protein
VAGSEVVLEEEVVVEASVAVQVKGGLRSRRWCR